jgi:flagellar basal body rod protein FlgG
MLNGIYSGATALDNYSQQQEVISTNLAHLNTPGYRREFLSFEEKMSGGDNPQLQPGSNISARSTDFSPGVKQQTGRQLDLAIAGDGFFVFEGEQGNVFSKNGILYRDPGGKLVNGDGFPVLDDGAPIEIPDDVSSVDLSISPDGQVSANGTVFGTISIVSFDDPRLLNSDSQVYFRIGEATEVPSEDSSILQGTRELANSHSVTELISMIVGSRGFEAAQRAIRTLSDAMQENIRS